MKIDYAIHSSDSNPYYLDFWPIVSQLWKEKFNVNPILIYIGDDNIFIDESFGKVIRLKPIDNIPIYLQTQIVRFWTPSLYPEKISIISDIDMLPLSIKYFQKSISNFHDDDYVHINPCIESYGRLPACYHIASGNTFKEVLDIDVDWESFLKKVLSDDRFINNQNENKKSWFADEVYSTYKVLNFHNQNRIKLSSRSNGQNGFRVDRLNWKYHKSLLRFDYYYDAHSIRPYFENRLEIDELKKISLNAYLIDAPKYMVFFFEIFDKIRFQLSKTKQRFL